MNLNSSCRNNGPNRQLDRESARACNRWYAPHGKKWASQQSTKQFEKLQIWGGSTAEETRSKKHSKAAQSISCLPDLLEP